MFLLFYLLYLFSLQVQCSLISGYFSLYYLPRYYFPLYVLDFYFENISDLYVQSSMSTFHVCHLLIVLMPLFICIHSDYFPPCSLWLPLLDVYVYMLLVHLDNFFWIGFVLFANLGERDFAILLPFDTLTQNSLVLKVILIMTKMK